MTWIQTYTGRKVEPLNLRPEDVDIVDIAHALSLTCRFRGHCKAFYSVAQHCVEMVFREAEAMGRGPGFIRRQHVALSDAPHEAAGKASRLAVLLWCLLHDAPEAYLFDACRPVKPLLRVLDTQRPDLLTLSALESRVMGTITRALDVSVIESKCADDRMLATEARDLMAPPPDDWHLVQKPYPTLLAPWPSDLAKSRYLELFERLSSMQRECITACEGVEEA